MIKVVKSGSSKENCLVKVIHLILVAFHHLTKVFQVKDAEGENDKVIKSDQFRSDNEEGFTLESKQDKEITVDQFSSGKQEDLIKVINSIINTSYY